MESGFARKSGNKAQDAYQTKGQKIMEVAEAVRPYLSQWLTGCRNEEGMLVQPAQIRAIALNLAQDLVNKAA